MVVMGVLDNCKRNWSRYQH